MAKKILALSVLIVSLFLTCLPAAANDAFVLQTGELSINNFHVHYSHHSFSVSEPGFAILRVTKATPDKQINGGFLFLNLRAIPLKHFFKSQDLTFEKKVKLKSINHLNVFLYGAPGASVTIDIRMENAPYPPPTITFSAEPMTITLGDAATLNWQTENSESVTIDNNIGAVSLNGSTQVTPTETTTYTLTASGPGGAATSQVTVTVAHLPPVAQLSAAPDTIVAGESSVLTWSTDFAQSCILEPGIGVVALNGSLVVTPTETTTYRIIATGEGGESSAEAVVTVTDPLPTVEMTSSAQTITLGESATLNWTSTDATACTIDPGIGSVATSGSIDVSPSETTTYTISATGSGGTATAQVTIAVEYPLPAITFSASPSDILLGQSSTLSWSTTYADSVEIDQNIGSVALTDTRTVSPSQTTTYTLTATGPGGTATSQVAVTVTVPMPTVTLQVSPEEITLGEQATLSWSSSNAVSLSIDNGIGNVGGSGSQAVAPTATTTYTITATGIGGNTATASAIVTVNPPEPIVSFGADPQSITLGSSTQLSWSTTYADTVTIAPDVGSVPVNGIQNVSPTQTTTYTLTAIGTGGTTVKTVTVTVIQVPTVAISASADTINQGESVTLTWSAEHADTCVIAPEPGSVPVNGSADVSPDQSTTYTVTATGPGGMATASVLVTVQPVSTVPVVSLEPASGTIAQGESVTLTWSSTGADTGYIDNGVGTVAASGAITVEALEHTMFYTLTVTGPGGSASASAAVHVAGNPTPQPQGTFGYPYNDLIPADATVDSYDEKRFAIVTGLVHDIADSPISGVSVTVHDHPEYGTVATDDEGRYAIPVEGGSKLTMEFRKQGLIAVHRSVNVPWNDIAITDTFRMIAEDSASTEITFDGNPDHVTTHQSTIVTDDDGSRSTTLIFTGDNAAYLTDENGSDIYQLPSINVRATEYTTPDAMPAALPPTSGFTYCAELRVDGAKRVRFAKPVVMWVDNFLGFDVGEVVPVGYYDRTRGVWVPSDNGVVVQLLDTDSDGVVDSLDSDADGQPDDLDQDGTFASEVRGLQDSNRYAPGATFWRSEISHFTPWDCNWPYGPPEDAIDPNPPGLPVIDKKCKDDCKSTTDSYVESRARIYNEDIPIPGTDMALHYSSDRAPGYYLQIDVPASGEQVPPSLRQIIVRMQIAGQYYSQELSAAPNQAAQFYWDRRDWLGNLTESMMTAKVSIGFVYGLQYYKSSSSVNRAFARIGGRSGRSLSLERPWMVITWKSFYTQVRPGRLHKGEIADGWSLDNHHHITQKIGERSLTKGDGTIVKSVDEKHLYNYLDIHSVITTFAGNNSEYGSSGDGGPASEAQLDGPFAVAEDKNGNIYILEINRHKVRKVDPDGIITTVAGNGTDGFSGDGGPADQAMLNKPRDLVVDADGNIYIADTYNHRIRKIDQNGIISTIAGRGAPPTSSGGSGGYGGYGGEESEEGEAYDMGDNGLATNAYLYYPESVAIDSCGNIYISDTGHHRVRKIDPGGIIATVAGTGEDGYGADDVPAFESSLALPTSLYIDTQNNIYILDSYNNRVRKVDPSGNITTVYTHTDSVSDILVDEMGNLYLAAINQNQVIKVNADGDLSVIVGTGEIGGTYVEDIGDGQGARHALLDHPSGLTFDPEGNLYIAQSRCVRKCATPSPFLNYKGIDGAVYKLFTEPNGLGYVVSIMALHTKTIDLKTGVTLTSFDFDENKHIVSITDRFDRQTRILRDGNGVPYEIISPDGLHTTLTVDGNNQLSLITLPDGNQYKFEYTPTGLMTAEIEPSGNRFSHVFDAAGRITDVIDEEGGHRQYGRSVQHPNTVISTETTAEGNVTTYQDHNSSSEGETSLITDANGDQTYYERNYASDTVDKTLACGTKLHFEYDYDPQYNYKFVKLSAESMPSTLLKTTTYERTYGDSNADGIPDLFTDTITVNGDHVTTETQDLASAVRTLTTPENRTVTFTYDRDNLLTTGLTVPGLYDTSYYYDSQGRLSSVQANARQQSFAYNSQGFLESVTDPENHTTSFAYDAVGRVISINRPDGGTLGFSYDPNGNMTVLTNPVDVDHAFSFNRVNSPNSYQTPISGSYSYVYDKDRRLIQTRFPSGKQINNIYAGTQLTQIGTPQGDIDLTYSCGGKVASMTKGAESIGYAFDGKLLTEVTLSGTLNQSLSYAYNNNFDVTELAYAGGTANYAYDLDGLLSDSSGYTISRNVQNGLPETVTGNGLTISQSFNGYGELDGQTQTVGSQPAIQWSVTRDDAGRILAKTETAGGETHNYEYSYDTMGRLLSVIRDGSLAEEYDYDLSGTRIAETNTLRGIANRSLSYSDEDHLLSAGDAVYTYDMDGFLSSKNLSGQVTTYNYSIRGELLNVSLPDGRTVSYEHDPLGRRIAKRIDGVIVEKYLWQGLTKLLAVYDGSDNLVQRYEYADGRMPVAMTYVGSRYFLAYDQVGSLRIVADASGNVVKRIDYDTFGNILNDTNSSLTLPFGFAGGLHDRDTGLVRFGYRDYDSDTGRWTAKDPIGFLGGDTDLYGYVQKNPVNWVDPYGLFDIALTPYAVAIAPALAMADSPILPFGDAIAGALIGLAWLHDNMPDDIAESEPTPCSNPGDFDPIKGKKAKKNKETGEIWEKDLLHKDHYEVYKNKKNWEKGLRDRSVWSDGRLKQRF